MTDPRISPEVREKLATVDFGLQVQQFLKTQIGAYLVRRAESEVEASTAKLKAHPILKDPAGAAQLQVDIRCAENVLYWLAEAITTGAQLMEQMIAEERQALGQDEGQSDGDPTGN